MSNPECKVKYNRCVSLKEIGSGCFPIREFLVGVNIPKNKVHHLECEVHTRYQDLEKIVELIKKMKKYLLGYDLLLKPYQDIYHVLAPERGIDLGYGTVLYLQKHLKSAFYLLIPFTMFCFLMPLISGFTKLPWWETLPLLCCVFGFAFINHLRMRLGVA